MNTTDIQRAFTGAPWESKIGYCRAVRVGNIIAVSGTAPVADDGSVHAPGDPYEQAHRCLVIIQRALRELGADMNNVVRTRMLVTDCKHWPDFGRAHGEFFSLHPPATSMIQIAALIHPDMMIEIEADAVC